MFGIVQQSLFSQIRNVDRVDFNKANFRINIGDNSDFGDFIIFNNNGNNCCEEESLDDISFGYDIGAALTASALIQQARERALNQWFDRQHNVLKKEIERQLGQSFSNYNDARNTYFKFHERIGLQRNHTPIENKYNSRRLDKENKQSISIKNLKLLRLRENEIKSGNINNSSYGNFTYNGTSLDQIQSLSQLQNLWSNETTIFSDNNWKYQNDRRLYYTVRGLGGLQDYNHEIFTDLFNKQLAFYNQYDRWKQLDLMQAFLNEIRPPLALPAGYISPQTYATSQYIEDYAKNKHLNTWTADNIFHPYYYQHTTVYQIWMAREGRQEAIERATAYVQRLRDAEINRLLNEVEIDKIDADGLTGKADCVYKKMVDNKNNINWILENFKDGGEPSEFDLKFVMSTTLGNLTNASTVKSGNTFLIKINQNRAENINTTLTIARTILHEGIHARLREFASREGSNETRFPGVYDYFREYGKNWDHQQMASHYRSTIAQGLKQYDNAQHSDTYYDALAWEGLSEIKDLNGNQDTIYTEAWQELSISQQQEVLNIISTEKLNGNKICQ